MMLFFRKKPDFRYSELVITRDETMRGDELDSPQKGTSITVKEK